MHNQNSTAKNDRPVVEILETQGINNLFQRWRHSFEEEDVKDSVKIFRQGDYKKFPPARFRMEYEFSENGDCLWMSLHVSDRHTMQPGTWKFQPEGKGVITIYDSTGQIVEKFRIVELKQELLQIDQINPGK